MVDPGAAGEPVVAMVSALESYGKPLEVAPDDAWGWSKLERHPVRARPLQ
jgi:hypothetical protein